MERPEGYEWRGEQIVEGKINNGGCVSRVVKDKVQEDREDEMWEGEKQREIQGERLIMKENYGRRMEG